MPRAERNGFTLLELLIALSIMSLAMTVVIATFVATLSGWRKGSEMLDGLHHGDFVMEQLLSATRSMAFFYRSPERYGFWFEDEEHGGYPADFISFVTSGTAFLPLDSPLAHGLHRLELTIDDNESGEAGVQVRAIPHLMLPEDYESDPWFVSSEVKGLDVRFYNMEEEDWEDDWENTNAIPSLIEFTLIIEPVDEDAEPYTISRLVEVPLGPVVGRAVQFRGEDRDEAEAAEGEEAQADGAVGRPIEIGDPAPGSTDTGDRDAGGGLRRRPAP